MMKQTLRIDLSVFLPVVLVWSIFSAQPAVSCGQENQPTARKPAIIVREEWGARQPYDPNDIFCYPCDSLKDCLQFGVIHNTLGDYTIRSLQQYHQTNPSYCFNDIGYHFFIIDDDGRIYEGREIYVFGAHAGITVEGQRAGEILRRLLASFSRGEFLNYASDARNQQYMYAHRRAKKLDPDWGAIGITMDGAFENELPNDSQLQSLQLLIAYLKTTYEIPGDNIIGHCEVNEKIVIPKGLTPAETSRQTHLCPGQRLLEKLAEMKRALLADHADTDLAKTKIITH